MRSADVIGGGPSPSAPPPPGGSRTAPSTATSQAASRRSSTHHPYTFGGLLAHVRPLSRLDLCFHGVEVETRALLHRRELDRRRDQFDHFLLNEHETPELVLEPFEIRLRSVLGPVPGPAGAL